MGNILIDLPMRLLIPPYVDNIKEFALKTSPAASKVLITTFIVSLLYLNLFFFFSEYS